MKLKNYLDKKGLNNREFGEMIGKSASAVSYLKHGNRKPSADVAKLIVEATKGEVTYADLFED